MPEHLKLIEGAFRADSPEGLSEQQIKEALLNALAPIKPQLKKVLLLPPDYTRLHANAGLITRILYEALSSNCHVDIMPALGTHVPVSQAEWAQMFAPIPYARMLEHNWRTEVEQIGTVPAEFVTSISEGLMNEPVPVEVNRRLLDTSYDLILSIGQVVPHEVVGMANQSKNVFVGCGGSKMINASHMLGALYGMERIMGKDKTPVRDVLDYASDHFIQDMPLQYILTVTDAPGGHVRTHGLFIGRERTWFEQAAALARDINITVLEQPVKKAVVYLDEQECKSTWLGNKAVYRTRMVIADGGELIILAPGVDKFGEDKAVDQLLRKYGYRGRDYVLSAVNEHDDLKGNLSAAAHLIHGSSDGRFTITYCTRHLTKEEVEGVGYNYKPYDEAIRHYPKDSLQPGENTLETGETIYYIPNPALGLWMERSKVQS